MLQFNQYDPLLQTATFRGIPLTAFKDGTFIKAERNEDTFMLAVGSQGDAARVRNRNASGKITVTLMQTSISNDLLSAVAQEDEVFGTGFGPFLVQDILGTTVCEAPVAWITKPAAVERSDQLAGVEWVFETNFFVTFIGGGLVVI